MAATFDAGSLGSGLSLSGGDLVLEHTGSDADANVILGSGQTTGKYYVEFTINVFTTTDYNSIQFGLATASVADNILLWANSNAVGSATAGAGWLVTFSGSGATPSFVQGDRVDFAWDAGAGKIWMRVNSGSWYGSNSSGNPATGANGFSFSPGGTLAFRVSMYKQNQKVTAVTASGSWAGSAPSGFGEFPGGTGPELEQAWQPNAFLYFPQASSGGTTYNVSITETATPSDSQTGLLTAVGARTETATFTDAQTGVLTMAFTASESGSASDSTTGLLTAVGAISESGSASDTTSATFTLTGAVSESGTASDSTTGLMTAVGSVSEIAASADSQSSTGVLVGDTSETSTITDTQTGGLAFSGSVSESGSASDTQSAAQTLVGATSESGAASDSQSTALAAVGAISESGAASDSQSGILTMVFTVSEAGAASDSSSATYTLVGDVSETGNAVDLQTTGGFISDSVTESASASDAQTGNLVISVSCSESANADDTCNATGGTPVGGSEFRVGGPDVVENFIPPTVADLYEVKKRTK